MPVILLQKEGSTKGPYDAAVPFSTTQYEHYTVIMPIHINTM